MSARNEIIALIKNNAAVQALLGVNLAGTKQRVYPIVIPSLENLPRIAVRQVGENPEQCKGGVTRSGFVNIQVNIYHGSVDNIDALDLVVEAAVQHKQSGGIADSWLVDRSDDFVKFDDSSSYLRTQLYRVFYENPAT